MRLVFFLVLSGCTATLSSSGDEAGIDPVDLDGGVDAQLDAEFDGGASIDAGDAGSMDSGAVDAPAPDTGPGDPCAGVSCAASEICVPPTGSCVCREGFVDMGAGCVAPPPGDPSIRSAADVCAAWTDGHVENASPVWEDDGSMCGPGTMSRDAVDDTVRRLNMFRWLSGLPNLTDDAAQHDAQMECAAMMSANGSLSHSPPMDWTCYTSEGAGAAGRSNIAFGYRSSAAAIDGYMEDGNTESLGHRRWILGSRLAQVGIGFSSVGGRAGQCLSVFGGGGSTMRTWSAYPNPGPTPLALATQRWWSFQAYSVSMSGETDAIITRVSDGMDMPVVTAQTGGGGPPPTLRIEPMGWDPVAGETYRVTITNVSGGDIAYEVTPVDC